MSTAAIVLHLIKIKTYIFIALKRAVSCIKCIFTHLFLILISVLGSSALILVMFSSESAFAKFTAWRRRLILQKVNEHAGFTRILS